MKNYKISLCLAIIIMSMLTIFNISSCAATTADLVFSLNSDGTGYIVSDTTDTINGAIVIPETYNSLPVVAIGDSAFANTQISSIEIPEGVVSIEQYAFEYCSSLVSVKLPTTLIAIDFHAFSGCSVLKKVYIEDVEAWNNVDFGSSFASPLNCGATLYLNNEKLTNLVFPEGTTVINSIAWRDCPTYQTVVVPSTVVLVEDGAFSNCNGIINFTIENNDGCSIGEQVFYSCDKLETVEIGEGVTSIEQYAFEYCSSLVSVKLPTTLIAIDFHAFSGCSSLKRVYIEDVEAWNNINFGSSFSSPLNCGATLYLNNEKLTNLVFPEGTTVINSIAWRDCPTYQTVVVPSTVVLVEDGAFSNCNGIINFTIENNDGCSIGEQAFYSCDKLETVEIGEGVTSIEQYAFEYCSSLVSVKLPTTLIAIDFHAFSGCSALKKVYIENIEAWNNINFGSEFASPLNYGATLYLNNEELTDLVFSEGILTINPIAWRNCDSYVSVTFPTSIISVPQGAFSGCDKLSYVFFLGSEEDWADVAVSDTTITDLAIHYNSADHTESDWIIDGDPTCTEAGFKYKECTVCGIVVETEEIEALGHEYDNGNCVHCGEKDPAALNGWILEDDKWAYYENGTKIINKWVKDSVGWCYLGADGYCVTNCWKADSYGWCYLDSNGRMVCNNWVYDNGKWYFMDANGYMVSNTWKKDSNGWCYLGSSGAMLTNAWVKDSVGWCYVGANGYCVTNKWVKDSKGWCYLDSNGRMVYNKWVKDSKGWCYVGSSGYMVYNQWVQTSGKWYYIDASGYMVTGTKVIGGKTYKFNSSGVWIG